MVIKKSTKKKRGATRNAPPSALNWLWGFSGLSVGCFVALLIYLDKIPTELPIIEHQAEQIGQQNNSKNTQKTKELKEDSTDKHQFGFYTILPDGKFETDNNSLQIEAKSPAVQYKKPPVQVKNDTNNNQQQNKQQQNNQQQKHVIKKTNDKQSKRLSLYQLQVGAFKELAKAEARKVQLAYMGIESNIQGLQNQGKKIYRLRVGPSTDEAQLKRIREKLQTNNVSSFIKKLKDA